ncbi:MAG: ATP-binding protein [bacterium]|nr:ATP-binding protein [bacterium]
MSDACLISASIPLERELDERLSFFIRLRWLAAAGILIGGWLSVTAPGARYDLSPLIIIGIGVAGYNGLFLTLQRRHAGTWGVRLYAQVAFDWIALTALVHFTGGVQSPVALAYILHIIIGALLLPGAAAWVQAAIATAVIGVLTMAEQQGWWQIVDAGPIGHLHPGSGHVQCWVHLTAYFVLSAFLTSSIAGALRRKEQVVADAQVRLDRAFHEMQALFELGQKVHATLDLEQVLRLIARQATELLGAKGCSIGLLDDAGTSVLPAASYGLSEGYLAKGPVEVARSAMVAQALAGEVVQVRDVAADQVLQYPDMARSEGIQAIVCVALQTRGRPIGVIRVYASTLRPTSEHEVAFLRNLANLAAVAIVSARAYADSQALSDERAWFARTTHHQLQAPLAVMAGLFAAIPFAGDLTPVQADLVARACRRVDELLALVRDLLDLAYAQRPSLHTEPQVVVLATSLAPVLETQQERAAHKGVQLQVDDLSGVLVYAESQDVGRIFGNLLDNAVKYTPSGGQVSLHLSRRGARICIEVADTGIGVAEADRERIFRGFYRTDAAKASGELGTGVGLSIVRRLVHRWHGSVELDSTFGEGSCFRVLLPSADADALHRPAAVEPES